MKNFARVMGLLFGSAGADTCPKPGQVSPPPGHKTLIRKILFNLALR